MSLFLNFLSVSSSPADTVSGVDKVLHSLVEPNVSKEKFWLIKDFWEFLRNIGLSEGFADFFSFAVACIVLIALVWVVDKVVVGISLHFIKRMAAASSTDIDDIFLKRKFFNRVLQLLPLLVVLFTVEKIFAGFAESMIAVVDIIARSIIVVVTLKIIYSVFDAWNDIYNRKPQANRRPIKGYFQIAKITLGVIATILIISIIFRKDPTTLFVGLGTAAALLMLVFKDTILGFVASIQLSAQDMVRIGDWISMPSKNADGTVVDINVNSVKVQNWDNTITMIPIYSMVSESFTNWRNMEQSAGRRFVRYFYVNMESVKLADKSFMERISRSKMIAAHIGEVRELAEKSSPEDTLTNLALLRAHIELFLKNHPRINENLSLYVRYKQEILDKGIGIEVYAFSHDKSAVDFDMVHRSVVEYVIASAPMFEISLFQSPSGMDFQRIQKNTPVDEDEIG